MALNEPADRFGYFQILEKLKASFAEGNPDEIKPDVLLNDQGDLLPYDQKFEFPRDKLIMGKQLGAGAFGIVMKATAYGITSNEEQTIVAVKMIRNNTDHKVCTLFRCAGIRPTGGPH